MSNESLKVQIEQAVATAEIRPVTGVAALFAPSTGIFRALRHRNYRLFWTGNFLSNIGTWMQNVAQGWLVLELTNSPFLLGVVGFTQSIPSLIFSLLGSLLVGTLAAWWSAPAALAAMAATSLVLAGLIALLAPIIRQLH